jgi:CheY-like chemotaxis protein
MRVPQASGLQLQTVNSVPKSIVVVEDEPSYAELISQLLSHHFTCPVHAFANPREAIHALTSLNPAVVITDYHLPQLTGLEFIKLASLEVPDAAFLLMSGQDSEDEEPGRDVLTALKGRLSKPFSWRALAEEVLRVWPRGTPLPELRGAATP